jgi:carbon-monoxide dehydrogenase large subunit
MSHWPQSTTLDRASALGKNRRGRQDARAKRQLDGDLPMTALPKFGIGQPVPRTEDPRLLRGQGHYTDDVTPAGTLVARLLRSDHAHGVIGRLDVAAAKAAPGVRLVLTGADLAGHGYQDLPCAVPLKGMADEPLIVPPHPSLARGRVRYVGQPLAMVVAETAAQAADALELISVEIDPLPPVADLPGAVSSEAAQLHDEAPGNVALRWGWGDMAAVDAAIAGAAHVTRLRLVNNRVSVVPMEPRGAVVSFADDRWTIETGCQGVFGLRAQLAAVLGVEVDRVHVLAHDIGGSFGMKASVFPEHLPLLHAARLLGQPIKWVNDRSESFTTDYHGRDSVFDAALALDAEGRFLAVKLEGLGNLGAYAAGFGAAVPTMVLQKNLASLYRLPVFAMVVDLVFTTTTPTTAYRGAGRPEAIYILERLIDAAARETGRDPVALRRLNLIPPEAIPYTAANGLTYDSGAFEAHLDAALERADWAGFAARREASRARGRLRGIGLTTYLEVTAPPGREMGGIRFAADGTVTIVTGTLDYGQGHRAPFAQVLADRLGVPFEAIELLQGDSDQLLFGGGTGGSRSIMATGQAIDAAARQVIEQGRELAADRLEAAPADIVFKDGTFTVAGTDRQVALMDLARAHPEALSAELVAETPPSAFPNGSHVAEVEIDPETGHVALVRYTAVDDFGVMVNPLLVEGQVHGGLVQGIGQALAENAVYDPEGQLLAGSFMDYAMPRADDMPDFDLAFHPVPATTNALGAKGCGEAGVTAAPPTIMNAVLDALAPLGITHLDLPATPEKVWRAIQAVRRSAA